MSTVPEGGAERAARPAELDLMLGRPGSHYLHLAALVLAGCADLAAFYGVIATILTDYAWAIWLVVIGVTAMAVMLSHLAGASLREAVEGELRGGTAVAGIAWGIWLLLGVGASYVRWKSGNYAAEGDPELAETVVPATVMLLALYLATGAVASIGAYVIHNRTLAALVRGRWQRRRLMRRRLALIAAYSHAEAVLRQRNAELDRDEWRWKRTRDGYHALADELRHTSSLYMAQRMQEPPATDGLTQPRPRTYPGPPQDPKDEERTP